MIDLEFIERLIRAIDASGIDSIELERGGTRIRLAKTPSGGAAPGGAVAAGAPQVAVAAGAPVAVVAEDAKVAEPAAAPAVDPNLVEIRSPMVGTFYRAPSPESDAYVEVGNRIATGDTLCIIEAMKLMNELEAEQGGTIVEICVQNAEPVEFGQVLFRIDPS